MIVLRTSGKVTPRNDDVTVKSGFDMFIAESTRPDSVTQAQDVFRFELRIQGRLFGIFLVLKLC